MPTVVTKTVAPSGGDYTSLSAAIAGEVAIRADLVTRDEQLVIECEAFTDTTAIVSLSAFTTDATRNIVIRAAAGHEHNGVPGAGYVLSRGDWGAVLLDCGQDNAVVADIEILGTGNCGGIYGLNTKAERLIVSDCPANFGGVKVKDAENCLTINCNEGFKGDFASVQTARNCTAIGSSVYGFGKHNSTSLTATNCVAFDCTLGFDTTNAPIGDYNASDDTTAPGANSVDNITSAAFADYVGGDYTPATSGVLDGAGTDLSASFTDDITGATRTQWDIGAFAAAVGGGGANYDVAMAVGYQAGATSGSHAAAQSSMVVASSAGFSATARADFTASIATATTAGQGFSAQADAGSAAVVSTAAGQSMTGAVSAVSDIAASILVSARMGATASAQAQSLAAMVAGTESGLSMFTGTNMDASMSVSAAAGAAMSATISVNADMTVDAQAGGSALAEAQAIANIEVTTQAAAELIANAAAQSGLVVSLVSNVAISGTSISGDAVTPDGRTYKVTLELRAFSVGAEDRTFTVH